MPVLAMPPVTIGTLIAVVVILLGLLIAIEVVPVNPLSVGGLFALAGLSRVL